MSQKPETTDQAAPESEMAGRATEASPPASQNDGGADPAGLATELEEARREASENYDKYLRVHADMDNYKKRIERTYADLARNSKKEILLKLLGVKDNLERALSYGENAGSNNNESVIQGVRLTEYQLDQMLRSEGVAPMDLVGKQFNPEEAEAISTVVDPTVEDHTVVNEAQRGYRYQDQVLRPAKVVVAVKQPGADH
jgi:molecular chaperone GrpE